MARHTASYELFGEQVELLKFPELEDRIRHVVGEYSLLKRRNEELEGLLKIRESELEEANKNIRGLNEEKDSVRTRVDSLLDMLQDINA